MAGMIASWERHGGQQVPGPSGAGTRLLLAGDTHGNLDWIGTLSKLAARHGCEGVVQLGDFGFWADQRVLRNEAVAVINNRWLTAVARTAALHGVWWRVIDGNHDAHPLARARYQADDNGVRPIRDGVLDWADRGAVWSWAGRRFAALGGAVSIDKDFRREGVSWWPTEEITDEEVDALIARAGTEPVDVLLSHDSPVLPDGIRPLSNPVLRERCERSIAQVLRAVDALRPRLVVHGHYHVRWSGLLERPWGNVRVEGLASDEQNYQHGHAWSVLALNQLAVAGE